MLIWGELEGREETCGWDIEEVEFVWEAESVMSGRGKDIMMRYD
jgi:hypothetical protein